MGGMCEEHIVHFEDYDFWLRLAGFGLKGGLLGEPVFFYRRHEHGRSRKIVKSGIDWKSELRRNNPFAYGDAIYFEGSKADLRSIVPCKKSLPGFSLLALWLWRSNLLPTSWPTVEMARVPIRSDPVDVMMILPWLQVGGADYYDLEVSKALSSMGLKTMIILDVTGNENPLISEFRAHVTGIFNLFTLLPMNHEQEDVDGLLDHFIETRRPKIVYVRNSTNGYRLSKRHANVKFVDIQHMWTPDDQLGWEYSSIPYADNLSLRLVISHQLKSIVQRLQNSSTLVSVVPPSVNMTLFTQKEPQKCWAESETVIFVGRLQEQKDPIKWIKVAKELSMRDPTMLFLMIGDGYLRDQVKLDLSTYLPGKHLLLPFQKQRELVEYLTYGLKRDSGSILRQGICPGRTLLLMTSRNEGLPYVILEAAALRVPSVAPRVGAIAEAELLLDGLLTSVASNDILAYVEAIDNAFQRSASIIEFPPTYRAEKFQKTIQELFNSLLQ
jgi:glycosyltransferase involved in cell wall biosynthesis